MASQTEIFNLALIEIGSDIVISPGENIEPARLLAVRWPSILDATLRAHPWNFALTRASLAKDSAAPTFGFTNAFTLPSDPYCLRVWQLSDRRTKFKVEGRKVKTDAEAPLEMIYISRVVDTTLFDPLFVEALAARLGSAVAFRLAPDPSIQKSAWNSYKEKLAEAREIDGQEGMPDDYDDSDYLSARA